MRFCDTRKGSNSTAKTVEMTRIAKEAGADAALVVVPYYNKPTQEGNKSLMKMGVNEDKEN